MVYSLVGNLLWKLEFTIIQLHFTIFSSLKLHRMILYIHVMLLLILSCVTQSSTLGPFKKTLSPIFFNDFNAPMISK
jgi:hypothetical protein